MKYLNDVLIAALCCAMGLAVWVNHQAIKQLHELQQQLQQREQMRPYIDCGNKVLLGCGKDAHNPRIVFQEPAMEKTFGGK